MTNRPFDLYGKVALITGTSRGLGQFIARALGRAAIAIAFQIEDEIHALG